MVVSWFVSLSVLLQVPANGLTETFPPETRAVWLGSSDREAVTALSSALTQNDMEKLSVALGVFWLAQQSCREAPADQPIDVLPSGQTVTCDAVLRRISILASEILSVQSPPESLPVASQGRWRDLQAQSPPPAAVVALEVEAQPFEPCPWEATGRIRTLIKVNPRGTQVVLAASLDPQLRAFGEEIWAGLESDSVFGPLAELGFAAAGLASARPPQPHCLAEFVDGVLAGAIRAGQRDDLVSAYALAALAAAIHGEMFRSYAVAAQRMFGISQRGDRLWRIYNQIESWFYAAGLKPNDELPRQYYDETRWTTWMLPGARGLVPIPNTWEPVLFGVMGHGGISDPLQLGGADVPLQALGGFSLYGLLEVDWPTHTDFWLSWEQRFGLNRFDVQAFSIVIWDNDEGFRLRVPLLNLTVLDTPCSGGVLPCDRDDERRVFFTVPFLGFEMQFASDPNEPFVATLAYAFDLRLTDKSRFEHDVDELQLHHVYAEHRINLSVGTHPWFYAELFFHRLHFDLAWHASILGGNLSTAIPLASGRFGDWIRGTWFLFAQLQGSFNFFHGDSELRNDNPAFPRSVPDDGVDTRWIPEAKLSIGLFFAGEDS